jgi:Asp/Glu/hydantoin racemase
VVSGQYPTRLLLVNGNASAAITAELHGYARRWFPGADTTSVTPPFGPPYVSTPGDYAVAGHAVAQAFSAAMDEHGPRRFDAGLVACFGEPGIAAARHGASMPVAGMAEASVLSAMQLGERFAIVTIGAFWPGMLRNLLRQYGLHARCSGIVAVDAPPPEDPTGLAAQVALAVGRIADRKSADVVILGGARLAGMADDLRPRSPLPLVCSLRAGIAQALALASIGL